MKNVYNYGTEVSRIVLYERLFSTYSYSVQLGANNDPQAQNDNVQLKQT